MDIRQVQGLSTRQRVWLSLGAVIVLIVAVLSVVWYVNDLKADMAAQLADQKQEVIDTLGRRIDEGVAASNANTEKIRQQIADMDKIKPATDTRVTRVSGLSLPAAVAEWNGEKK